MIAAESGIRSCESLEEFLEAASIFAFYLGRELDEAWARRALENFETAWMLAAFDDGAVVGAIGAFRFSLAVPGGNVLPTAGLAWGGILPSHRRRGIYRDLMMRHLYDAHERGEPLVCGLPGAGRLRGFGWGEATFSLSVTVPRITARFRQPAEGTARIRHLAMPDALETFPEIYDAALKRRPGMLARSRSWWEFRILHDAPHRRHGGGPAVRAMLELDGAPQGYAIYRLMPGASDETLTEASVDVIEAVAASDRAEAHLWRYILEIDGISAVEGSVPRDHPLPQLLEEPRFAQFRLRDDTWLRIVDVERALGARAYATGDALTIEVHDPLCDWNASRWRIESGSVTRTSAAADLAIDIADLSSALLGGVTLRQLRAAGRIDELRDGIAERGDALLGTHPAPWCPDEY